AGGVHYAVDDERHGLEAEVAHVLAVVRRVGQELLPQRDRVTPLEGEPADVGGRDLVEAAEAVAADVAVVGDPVAGVGLEDAGEVDVVRPWGARFGRRARFDAALLG